MLQRKANERGKTNTNWLNSSHSFSFADYHDPKWNRFQSIRVINEDIITPGSGFGAHGHQDMEILTFVLEGALEHQDSMHNHEVIYPYQLQKMSAGSGILHSEFNHYKDKSTHFYQIWILPDKRGIEPSYQTLNIKNLAITNQGILVASPNQQDQVIHLEQKTYIYYYKLDGKTSIELPKETLWLQVLKGKLSSSKDFTLQAGDAIGIEKSENHGIDINGDTEFLLFTFPEP